MFFDSSKPFGNLVKDNKRNAFLRYLMKIDYLSCKCMAKTKTTEERVINKCLG